MYPDTQSLSFFADPNDGKLAYNQLTSLEDFSRRGLSGNYASSCLPNQTAAALPELR